jgi:hypothetical protein
VTTLGAGRAADPSPQADGARLHRPAPRHGQTGAELTGPNPTDRAERGTTCHLLVDAHGLPVNVAVSDANRNDSMLVEPIPDSMPAIHRGGRRGHPRRRPVTLHADEGYDVPRVRPYLRRRGITARMARIGHNSSARLGGPGWVVEHTLSGC